MNLSEHFSLEEFTASDTASRRNIDNTPPDAIIDNLRKLAETMELVRALLGQPIHITSGYRCSALNKIIGSKPSSSHVQGLACDFKCPEYGSPDIIANAIAASEIDFDQVIFEFCSWVHIGIGAKARKQVLTINSSGTFTGVIS